MTQNSGDLVRPFAGMRPAPGRAAEIAAPPYDVVSTAEARQIADGKPFNFLHISRAEIDLPPGTDAYSEDVYETAARNLKSLEESGALMRDAAPAYYVYRMTTDGVARTGVAVSASVAAYNVNRIRKHELTRPAKEDDRVRQIEAVDAITGPVLVVHRAHAGLAACLSAVTSAAPDAEVPDLDGTRHELWAVSDPERVSEISEIMNGMEALYIADGHHRSAAGARVSAARGADRCDGFLAVSFPDDEVTILDYNRVVRDLGGKSPDELIAALSDTFDVAVSDDAVRPSRPQSFGMYLAGKWYRLTPLSPMPANDPVEALDVRILSREILEPHLGVGDPRTDPRIDFIGGSRGVDAIAAAVDSGDMAVGFTLFPTSLAELMAVADAGEIMPPKSTWFDPKLADGLISLPLD